MRRAAAGGADYWGIGPWRTTGTKADAGAALGADGFARIVRLSAGTARASRSAGYGRRMCAPVLAAGGAGVAVVSGILGEDDVEAAARRVRLSA